MSIDEGSDVVIHTRGDGEERMIVSDAALIPAELCKTGNESKVPETPLAGSPVFKPGPPAVHDHVALKVAETAGATRIGEIASQAARHYRDVDCIAASGGSPGSPRRMAIKNAGHDNVFQDASVSMPAPVHRTGRTSRLL